MLYFWFDDEVGGIWLWYLVVIFLPKSTKIPVMAIGTPDLM